MEKKLMEKEQGISIFQRYLTLWVLLCMVLGVLFAIPLILQTFLIFAMAYVTCYVLKLPHKIAAPAGMIGASNFFELSVAVNLIQGRLWLQKSLWQ